MNIQTSKSKVCVIEVPFLLLLIILLHHLTPANHVGGSITLVAPQCRRFHIMFHSYNIISWQSYAKKLRTNASGSSIPFSLQGTSRSLSEFGRY